MKRNKLLLLVVITLAVAIAAGITAELRAPRVNVSKELLFPDLAGQINDVTRIRIEGDRRTVILEKSADNWVIANADNYPALFNKVRKNVISLSELRVVDQKTDNPELYSKLGVEDPRSSDTPALLFTLENTNNETLASVIAGLPRQSSGSKPGLYVRKPDEDGALLVEGSLDLSDEKRNWFDQQLINIPPGRVRQISIQPAEGAALELYKTSRQQADFELRGTSSNDKGVLKIILNRIATGLEELRADDVIACNNFDFPVDTTVTTVTTFDGLIITIHLTEKDDQHYAHFSFMVDPANGIGADKEKAEVPKQDSVNVAEEVRQRNKRLSDWVYTIPGFKYDDLTTTLKDINKPFRSGQSGLPDIK